MNKKTPLSQKTESVVEHGGLGVMREREKVGKRENWGIFPFRLFPLFLNESKEKKFLELLLFEKLIIWFSLGVSVRVSEAGGKKRFIAFTSTYSSHSPFLQKQIHNEYTCNPRNHLKDTFRPPLTFISRHLLL